tara:strand:+ start:124 stop:1464 length:1341 start_codon:yes stop_codon:yes gene_type:complete
MSIPKKTDNKQGELFKSRLSKQLDPAHEIFTLSRAISWDVLEEKINALHPNKKDGQPPKPVRLIVGMLMLQHIYNLSDEAIVERWVENPYWQYFCGFNYLQWDFPINPSTLTRWRKRLGDKGMQDILQETVKTALKTGAVKEKSLESVIVDTTVMEKNITHPTDSKLMNKAREHLVSVAKKEGVVLRQSYTKLSKTALIKAARYAHASQFKRMRKQVKTIKNYLGRVVRDVERQLVSQEEKYNKFEDVLGQAKQLLSQTKTSKNKLYSLHAPEVSCIAKGKAHKRYEFGCKVSLTMTYKEGLVLESTALQGNPFDGHTLKNALNQAQALTTKTIIKAFVDKGYKGHDVRNCAVYMSGQKRLTPALKKALKRRSAIEPHIGHMKNDGKLGRNYLKGVIGDKVHAILCAVGHNLRLILNHLWFLYLYLIRHLNTNLKKLLTHPYVLGL